MIFANRVDAGQRLASLLHRYAHRSDTVVVALPRGGVPVAAEVAKAIAAPLDILVVRKLGVPGSEEMAMGAIASGGFAYLNRELIQRLKIDPAAIEQVAQAERQEMRRREEVYRQGNPKLDLRDRTVILVDDGLATGATTRVAISAINQQHPKEFVVAVPVSSQEVCHVISQEVDHVICAETPKPFYAVGLWYEEFFQTTDEEVQTLLQQSRQRYSLSAVGGDR